MKYTTRKSVSAKTELVKVDKPIKTSKISSKCVENGKNLQKQSSIESKDFKDTLKTQLKLKEKSIKLKKIGKNTK